MKGRPSACATLRPIAVLPAPIRPTKTTDRPPRCCNTSAERSVGRICVTVIGRIDMKSRCASSADAIRRTPLELTGFPSHNGTGQYEDRQPRPMPTLFRLLVVLGVIVALVYGTMFALVTYVEPKKGEMTVRIPVEKLNKQQ